MTTFVALGDSITVGMGDPAPEGGGWRGWAPLLAASLHQPVIHNLATLGALAVDVERIQLPAATELKPDVASVVVGINDTLRGNFDPQRTGAAPARGGSPGAHYAATEPRADVRPAEVAGQAAEPANARGERGRGRDSA